MAIFIFFNSNSGFFRQEVLVEISNTGLVAETLQFNKVAKTLQKPLRNIDLQSDELL